ncbi:MAG: alpha/beta family hydrolase [Woeseiaceae bacterium]|nr:alpha/beta family hydrolase [Woeseiaceae bacterium]
MPKNAMSRELHFDGKAGKLQGLLEAADESRIVASAVVCHPHPLHGGTMQNKVAHMLARSFVSQNFVTLRFNFRGVEKSDGTFDDGKGELEDVFAAMELVAARYPGLPLWLGGFSFGAAMAVLAAAQRQVAGLVSIAPAVSRLVASLPAQPDCPWLILQGDQDELVNVDETIAWVNDLEPGPELIILDGAEHFFHGKLVLLKNAVEAFIQKHLDRG